MYFWEATTLGISSEKWITFGSSFTSLGHHFDTVIRTMVRVTLTLSLKKYTCFLTWTWLITQTWFRLQLDPTMEWEWFYCKKENVMLNIKRKAFILSDSWCISYLNTCWNWYQVVYFPTVYKNMTKWLTSVLSLSL